MEPVMYWFLCTVSSKYIIFNVEVRKILFMMNYCYYYLSLPKNRLCGKYCLNITSPQDQLHIILYNL